MRVPGFGRSATSYNSFIIIALLDEWKNREKGSQTILREAIGQVVSVPETFAFPISPQSIRVSSYNKPVQMVIYGSSYEELEEIQNSVLRELRKNRNMSRIETELRTRLFLLPLLYPKALFPICLPDFRRHRRPMKSAPAPSKLLIRQTFPNSFRREKTV